MRRSHRDRPSRSRSRWCRCRSRLTAPPRLIPIDCRIAPTLLAAGALDGRGFRSMAEEAAMLEEPWSVDGLVGTLARPVQQAANAQSVRQPFALLLAGSGPSPRDGTFGTLRRIAEGLAAAGIGSLRYDKRGIGASAGL